MAEISRVALFGKLNSLGYKAIESATVFCKLRGNPYVELVHWLHQVLQLQDSDLHRIIQHFSLNPSRVAKDFTDALDRLPRGATSISDLSSHVDAAVKEGWVYATLMFKDAQVRTGHLIVGMLKTPDLRNALLAISREFDKIKLDELIERFGDIIAASPESGLRATDGSQVGGGAAPGEASEAIAPAQMGKQEALQRFSVDLTERARTGELDPIVGRDEEIRQIVDILMRRRQNNPILTGEAGVGKTAVVEGFAQRIAAGDVPPPLQDVTLRVLDVGLLQAGASMKGEFENRLRQVIDEVQSSPKPIILFIDEAHTLIGAGGAAGTGDAANLLKPALARGKLRTIAATTWAEYKKHIEKDPALTRRFQVVQVGEPTEEKTVLMMRGMASTMEQHHRVQILDEALEAAVKLSHRYIPARQLPDKAVSLLDTASARVAISLHAVPAEVEDCRRHIEALNTELEIIDRETAVGVDTAQRQADAQEKLQVEQTRLGELEARWEEEKGLVAQILELRAKLRGVGGAIEADTAKEPPAEPTLEPNVERTARLAEMKDLQAKLHELQGEKPLILPDVDAQAVASVVADWTGIPVGRMVKNEIETVLKLADLLNRRIIGQRHALDMIARRIQTSRAALDNPNKPIGVFMLAGPSGVGKTETALALAESLYGGEQNVITINMSEFQEAHTVSTLKGAPPGYVGYGEGGVLTEAVRRRPYSVVLLDEVEKAHHDVHEIFFQVFDKGWMEDGEGRFIDFKNTLILLTTNVGTDLIANMCKDPELLPDAEGLSKALREPLLKVFPPALLGRLVTIPYYPLNDAMIGDIVRLQLGRIEKRILENHKVPFVYDDEVVKLIVSRCTELESGGRMVDAILTNTVLPAISEEFLKRIMAGQPVARVQVRVQDGEFAYAFE
ncbi:MAG: type VI secretion system ATPase TssH [Candidatus Competibacteraceae bacterium]|nr:type VI secretion system ATPase TssH [Candidatus Competibacteraceae bacterium]MCP5124100.1 type VI secretion system ATPase TssH [Gammaproteobacteria bacterium]HRX70422.1 type VI secretion system ATPase TssH [Candidatus Competibacteraceae bacterium]